MPKRYELKTGPAPLPPCVHVVCFSTLAQHDHDTLTGARSSRSLALFSLAIGIGAYANMKTTKIFIPFGMNLSRAHTNTHRQQQQQQHYYVKAVSTAGFNTRFSSVLSIQVIALMRLLVHWLFVFLPLFESSLPFLLQKYILFPCLAKSTAKKQQHQRNTCSQRYISKPLIRQNARQKTTKRINTPNQMKVKQNVK